LSVHIACIAVTSTRY